MYRHSKRLRPLDPSSSDDEDSDDDSSDTPEETDLQPQEELPSADGGDNINQEIEHATMPGIPDDGEVAGPSSAAPLSSALRFPLDAFDLFPSGGPYEFPPNFSLMDLPPPTPGGPSRDSPVPTPSRDSPQPSTSRAALGAALDPQPIPTIVVEEPQPGPSSSASFTPAPAEPSTSKAAVAALTRQQRSSARLNPKITLTIPRAPRPITAIRTNKNDPTGKSNSKSSLRRIYSDLIEKCQGFEDKEGLESDLQKVMTANISEGSRLFEGLKRIGGGPGDMLMAFLHTQMCSQVIRFKSYTIGSTTSGFKMDLFLKAVAADHKTGTSDLYSPRLLAQKVSKEAAAACRSVPFLGCLVGTFDRDRISPSQKEKKQRAPPRKRVIDPNQTATQHEEISIKRGEKETKSPETLKQEIFKILKKYHRTGTAETNLLEFTIDKNSFANSVEYLFYVGFLIRDGYVSLARGKDKKPGDSTLVIKPDKPIQKQLLTGEEVPSNGVCRNQYILSFSPKLWKQLSTVASGDDIITKHKTITTRP